MFKTEPPLKISQYVWVKSDGSCVIIDDPIKVSRSEEFSVGDDKFYRLGEEVAVQVSIVKVGKTYR